MEIRLKHGALTAAADTHGGELVSLRDGAGTEYIWGGDPASWTGRNPLLFPIVGGLKDGVVRIDGVPYAMSRHGFARGSEFELAERGEDFVTLKLRESAGTLARYPYPFSLRVTHRLTGEGFVTSFRVENTGPAPMPFCIGGHTAFRCPLGEGERFEDYELVFDQPETADFILLTQTGLVSPGGREPFLNGEDRYSLNREIFARLDTIMPEGPRSTGVSLRHRKSGRGVRLDFSQFPMVAFWTKGEAPFLCLEPWHGCAALEDESGEFTDKPHCIVLAPGGSRELSYTVTLLH